MLFDVDGGWLVVTREHETVWLFTPYDLAEDIWTERTAGVSPSRLILYRWMTDKHLLLVLLATGRGALRFQQDPRFAWIPIPPGSDLYLKARADRRKLESPDDLLDEDETPKGRTLLC